MVTPGPDHGVWTAAALQSNARTASTWRAYAADWADFSNWCRGNGAVALPAEVETVGAYLAERGRALRPSTLARRVAAIVVHHRQHGHVLDRHAPAIADTLAGLARALGTAPVQKMALSTDDIRALVLALPRTPKGLRDRAILLVGFASACRRSELASLQRDDLAFTSDGLMLMVCRGKEDQQGKGDFKGIPFGQSEETCPVRSLKAWMMAARLEEGPLFRRCDRSGRVSPDGLSGDAIAMVVKGAVRRLGERQGWSRAEIAERVAAVAGHSLRAGFVTSAARSGAAEWAIMRHTGHKSTTTLRRYIRQGGLFEDNVAGNIGL